MTFNINKPAYDIKSPRQRVPKFWRSRCSVKTGPHHEPSYPGLYNYTSIKKLRLNKNVAYINFNI